MKDTRKKYIEKSYRFTEAQFETLVRPLKEIDMIPPVAWQRYVYV